MWAWKQKLKLNILRLFKMVITAEKLFQMYISCDYETRRFLHHVLEKNRTDRRRNRRLRRNLSNEFDVIDLTKLKIEWIGMLTERKKQIKYKMDIFGFRILF